MKKKYPKSQEVVPVKPFHYQCMHVIQENGLFLFIKD